MIVVLAGITVLLLVFLCVLLLRSRAPFRSEYGDTAKDAIISTQQERRIAQCRSEILGQLKPKVLDLKLLAGLHGLCYARVNEEDSLAEFAIRQRAFINQQAETGVLMWLVVVITVSGVILAALQLLAGFKLAMLGKAAFEQGGQFALEAKKVSVNSSVTGVLVLVISLGFFYVFSKEIYLIKEEGEESHRPAIKSVTGSFDMKAGWDPAVANTARSPAVVDKKIVPENAAVAREAVKQQEEWRAGQKSK